MRQSSGLWSYSLFFFFFLIGLPRSLHEYFHKSNLWTRWTMAIELFIVCWALHLESTAAWAVSHTSSCSLCWWWQCYGWPCVLGTWNASWFLEGMDPSCLSIVLLSAVLRNTKLVTTSGVIQFFFSIQIVPVHEVAIWSKQRVCCIVPLDDLALTDVLRTDNSFHEPCLLHPVGQNDSGISSGWSPSLWILSRTDSAIPDNLITTTRRSDCHPSLLGSECRLIQKTGEKWLSNIMAWRCHEPSSPSWQLPLYWIIQQDY